jgi:glycosyltransferase involved in cell wall biosynthesis
MNPSVSVVIPAFNHAAFVGEAIRSVLEQSHGDLEIVITDDGSRDGTPDVIRRFADPRIDLEVFGKNRGAGEALNSAIRRSRGEFICMLASDDVFLPGKLEKQVRFLRDNPHVAAVFGMPRFIDQRGAPLADSFNGDVFQAPFTKNLRTRPDWLRHFFYEGNCLCHPASMVRRAVYDKIGLFDQRLANTLDFDMWVRMCMTHEIRVVPDEFTAMRILDANRNMTAPRRDSNLRALIEYFHILKHYRGLSRATIGQVFAREIAAAKLDAEGASGALLAELALLSAHPSHKLFALDTMFETMSEGGDYPRLIELAGVIDVFAIETVRAEPRLLEQLGAARARVEELRAAAAEMAAAHAAVTRAQEAAAQAAEAKQRLADRLHAALNVTYAEAMRLNDRRETAEAALQAIAAHTDAITTRSRVYRLARVFGGLRRRIETIAAEAARGLGR